MTRKRSTIDLYEQPWDGEKPLVVHGDDDTTYFIVTEEMLLALGANTEAVTALAAEEPTAEASVEYVEAEETEAFETDDDEEVTD